jgi:hypothetical protein
VRLRFALGFGVALAALVLPFGVLVADPSTSIVANDIPPERISAALCKDMQLHHVLRSRSRIPCDRLRLVKFGYIGFDGEQHGDGEVVVLDAVAVNVARIFAALRDRKFPIAKARLMNHYEGNDDVSMADNNTSAFNDRNISGGNQISLHALGLAIDINPVQNPYVTRSGNLLRFLPVAGVEYANRLSSRPRKQARQGMAESIVDLLAEDGFLIWGGYWDNPIDYQHFEVDRRLANRLVEATPAEAEKMFNDAVQRYRRCRHESPTPAESYRAKCIELSQTAVDPYHEHGSFNSGAGAASERWGPTPK